MTKATVIAAELEQRAERAVRRGELLVALEHFEAYLAQQPDDDRVRQRMESVRALLQPSELVSRRRSEPEEPAPSAETLSEGRFDAAVAAYQRAVERNSGNLLLRERLEELRALARPAERADMAGAEKLQPISTPPREATPARSAKVSDASFAPMPPKNARSSDPVQLLKALLNRIRSSRKA